MKRLIVLLTLAMWQGAHSQAVVLDDFESFTGWQAIVSEGAVLKLASGEGKTGQGLVMDFDLSGVYGYVIARKDFNLELPSNYQFTFDLRAEIPVNNFEFKLTDDKENVFWIKKLNVDYPKEWTRQRIRKRQISFAWGPAGGGEIHSVRKIEFVVSCGNGGKGKVFIDNFRFEAIDDEAGRNARAEVAASAMSADGFPAIDSGGTILTHWRSAAQGDSAWLSVDFHRHKEVGGLVIDWDSSACALSYDVMFSDDGKEWTKAYAVRNGNGGRDYVCLSEGEGRFIRLACKKSNRNSGFGILRMEFKDARFSGSPNDFFRAVAADAPPGFYPMYYQDRQSYWTIVGVSGDTKESLVNEQGQIEVDKLKFSLEPFLFVDGKFVTWSDVTTTPSLMEDYLPIPSVTWKCKNGWSLTIQAVAGGVAGNSLLGVRYTLESAARSGDARLFIAMRPFQVNPPWQKLNAEGGAARIDSIVYRNGIVYLNGMEVIPLTKPTSFGAAEFDQGDITGYLSKGILPPATEARDHFGYASAALEYDLTFSAGEAKDVYVAVPYHGWRGSPRPDMNVRSDPALYYSLMRSATVSFWESKLNRIHIALPSFANSVVNTLKSNLAYIFINRDGPGIQPGSRSYERSWIRDGSLTCSALLRTGNTAEVRDFIDWYARGQFPNGKIPCVIDARGPDATPEHDSHGEFIYAVSQYFQFTKDTVWLRGKFDNVINAVRYIQSLRNERKTETYRNGTAEQRACYGLVPESISHEGYWDVPRHSYWDDFFILRGLKDAATIAEVLGDKARAAEYGAERDDFRKDLYASMQLAMKNRKIDYIPGCAELGDFDATSTTIGISPGGELGRIPEPQLHATFDKYERFFVDRVTKKDYHNYTPYETRVIGTFVMLGQKKRAEEALIFFMNDRRPASWNEWAEVVWRDPATPKSIGDMPHTWVGSDFIRSVLTMFVYEREKDGAYVLAAGIPDAWIRDSAGVQVHDLCTYDGSVHYSLHAMGKKVVAELSGTLDASKHKVVLASPLLARPRSVTINGRNGVILKSGEVLIKMLPARVELRY